MKLKKSIFLTILSLITVLGININIDKNVSFLESFNGNSLIYVLLFIMFIYFYDLIFNKYKDKKIIRYSIIFATFISVFSVIGYSLDQYADLSNLFSSITIILKNIIKISGNSILLSTTFILLFSKILITDFSGKELFKSTKRNFFLIFLIIIVSWIPYFLAFYPGICSPDSLHQIAQSLNTISLNNHHPVFHTLLVYISIMCGKTISSLTLGIAIYSIIQMILMAIIFTHTICFLNKQKVNPIFIVLCLCFYALIPLNALYSITMWKDILFSGIILIFTIFLYKMIKEKNFFSNKFNILKFIILCLLVILLRNNGFYVFLITLPILYIFLKNHRKYILISFVVCFSLFLIYKGPIFNLLNIQKGSVAEALSIPLQQFARVEKYKRNEMTVETKEIIDKWFSIQNIGDHYDPRISDQVKLNFNTQYFQDHKSDFIKDWAVTLFDYPDVYIESFLSNSYGYWHLEAKHWTVGLEIFENDLDLATQPISKTLNSFFNNYSGIFNPRTIPVIGMIFSVGFHFLVLIFLITILILKKNNKFILMCIPLLALWLTCLASPVFLEFRYIYSLFITLPFLITITLNIKNKIKK